ncbi:protein kinase [Pyxidicoccus parkwayensis]|uniref:Protein kinase n=1 Tax=Pyxidicoccus parkwayensis TaxID=2813578 RepID=A0ABX7NQI6_9BACT|nr:protein kinase [Pyxidicoccus parkwaysis]QSQ21107.1 protein kinase [Pyxidicoccus parkwaysis]
MAETSPQQFGKYVLLSKIAAGGMAVTYRARMTGAAGVTKPCVIKQILPHFVDDSDFVEMFIGEARLVASMSHSNIAQVFDFGEVDGQYFIAMELVQGQPLSKVLRRAQKAGMGFFPEPLALHIASKLCDGLDYAHRHVGEDGMEMGLVHRDVSPDNVLISYEGEVKVIDFGIAKATSVVEAKTSPGTLKGKYPYFSPEQAQGRQDLDARTDVYAAGVVLYEMVCGRRPYEGEFVAVLPRIVSGDCLPPSAVNPSVSAELETVISHAMAIDRDSRYQTGKELSESLVELLYRDNPRFTPAMLSQLMAYLFAEELAAEGRKAPEVTPAFKEQLALWQTGYAEPSQGRARPLSSNSQRSSPGSPGVRKPPSDGGGRPTSERRSPTSNPAVRRVTSSGGMRRVTNPNMPRSEGGARRPTTSERSAPPVPELPDEPSTDAGLVEGVVPTLAAPRDTPVETPAVDISAMMPSGAVNRPPPARGPNGFRTAADEARDKLAAEEAERASKRQQQVRTLSVYIFGSAAVLLVIGLLYNFVFKSDWVPGESEATTTLWVTSKPAGAQVKLNNHELVGRTPLMVEGVIVGQANTLVLTLPGHLAWTRRFTPTSKLVEPINAELQPLNPPATPPELPVAANPTADAGTEAQAVATPDAGAVVAAAETPDAGAEAAQAGDAELRALHEVDYPTRVLVLRPMYNAAPIPEYNAASIDLNPGAAYSVWTEGNASLAEGRGTASGTLAYYAEGDLPADNSFGLLSASMRTIKGAKKLYVFALDDNGPDDNSGTIRVNLRQSAYVPPRSFNFDAKTNAVQLKPEHQVVLRGLNPRSTYLFTVRDDFAELRSSANGRVRQVLCVERGPDADSVRSTHRLLETGKRYQVTGAEDLRCTFPDSKLTDNQGAIEVDVVDVTVMSRKERAEALKGSRRSER